MRISEKCRNNKHNNSDNPLTSRRTDGGKNCVNYRPFEGAAGKLVADKCTNRAT